MKTLLGIGIAASAVLGMGALVSSGISAQGNERSQVTNVEQTAYNRGVDESEWDYGYGHHGNGSMHNGERGAMHESRRAEYEAYIDQEVKDGKLSQDEANAYKSDFEAMREYCRNDYSNNGSQGMRRSGSCHSY